MDKKFRVNNNVFNYEGSPLFTRENASNRILYNTFTTAQTNTTIWTPAAGKSIYLTAVQASSLSALTITLNRAGNAPFLSIVLTSSFAAFGESFSSPVKFLANEVITLTTSAAGTIYITLLGYEI